MGIFQIPGNIKQEIIPFVLNPEAEINKNFGSSTEIKQTPPQFFTYRQGNRGDDAGGKGMLHFFPSAFDSINLSKDLSYKMLYKLLEDGTFKKDKSVKLSDLLNFIPGVLIREYLPDTKLDLCLNFFIMIFNKIKSIFSKNLTSGKGGSNGGNSSTAAAAGSAAGGAAGASVAGSAGLQAGSAAGSAAASSVSSSGEDYSEGMSFSSYHPEGDQESYHPEAAASASIPSPEASTFDKIVGTVRFAIKYMLGDIVNKNLPDNLLNSWNDPKFGIYKMDVDHARYVMKFPWNLYYNLLSCVTTNIYEIPAISSSKRIANSDGMAGWTGGGSTGLRLSKLLDASSVPLVGGMINGIISNIAIDYLPWWNSEAGAPVKEPEISIEFDLFNDSAEAAMINFIFVNTIIPHNKWILYHLFQHSPAIYDVKIEGVNRLFACAGSFDVTYQGVLRDPPVSWLEELCKKHANCKNGAITSSDNLLSALKTKKIIKIPDVYHVVLKFLSLLPANFNNLMYNFAMNSTLIDEKERYGFHKGKAWDGVEKATSSFFEDVKKVWDANGDWKAAGFMDSEEAAAEEAAAKEAFEEEEARYMQAEEDAAEEENSQNQLNGDEQDIFDPEAGY